MSVLPEPDPGRHRRRHSGLRQTMKTDEWAVRAARGNAGASSVLRISSTTRPANARGTACKHQARSPGCRERPARRGLSPGHGLHAQPVPLATLTPLASPPRGCPSHHHHLPPESDGTVKAIPRLLQDPGTPPLSMPTYSRKQPPQPTTIWMLCCLHRAAAGTVTVPASREGG